MHRFNYNPCESHEAVTFNGFYLIEHIYWAVLAPDVLVKSWRVATFKNYSDLGRPIYNTQKKNTTRNMFCVK